ncbi:MAG: hypothetical protein FJZ96_15140 [Chloroflexi bacterium]|nr:hypothetical protein [Chloroflexota bacterium]
MDVEYILQETSQLATLAGLLGGFAFAAVIQLLSSERKGKVATWTIAIFATATLMFLVSLLVFVLYFSAVVELKDVPESLGNLGTYALLLTFASIFVLLGGIGLSGWIRSRATGLITTILALTGICVMGGIISSVISLFM